MKERERFYRLIDHTADLGMEIYGADAAELFVNAGRALFDTLVAKAGNAAVVASRRTIVLEGADWADLMVNWLRELLYYWNDKQLIPMTYQVNALSERKIDVTVSSADFAPDTHTIEKEIKAVTYHQIEVGPCGDGWRARVIFDV